MKRPFSRQYAGTNHIGNPERAYIKSVDTDIRATFERIRAEQAKAATSKPHLIRFRGK